MKQRLFTAVSITAFLLIVIAISLYNREQEIPPSPLTDAWAEMSTWSLADRRFPSHPEEPLLLYEDEKMKKSIYIQDGMLRSLSLDNTQDEGTILLNIEAADSYYWRSGNTLLLAIPIHQGNPDNYMRGEWYAIDLGDTEAIQPSILKLEDAFIDPGKLLTVTIVEAAELFLLVEDNDNVHFNEYFYAAGESRLSYVNLEIPRNDESYYKMHYLNNRPQATVDVQHFQKETPYPLADGSSIYAYEDDRGTLLVYHSGADNYRNAIRYAGVKLINVALKTDILGNAYPLIWTDGPITNTASMSYPTMGNGTSLHPTEELLNDEWRMVNMRHFYRIDGNTLKTIRFESRQGPLYSDPEHRAYELPGQPVDDHHGLLALESNGIKRYLSVFDLLNGRGALNELWMQDLPATLTSSVGERAKEDWELLNEAALPAEIAEHIWKSEELPKEVSDAANRQSESECILDCDPDFYNIPQIRSIEGTWHMLIGDNFYQVKDGKLSLLGQFPITTAFTHGEGNNGYTALDYTRIGTDWYVADTYGDRVIKLDDKLEVIAEYPLSTPSHIVIIDKDKLQVKSLQGITTLDLNLSWIDEAEDIPVKVKSAEPSEQLFPKISHYIDKKLGTHWVYTGQGKLITYNPASKQYKTIFIGNPQSGRAIVRIFPYQDEILVLSDYRLHRFNPDGQWKDTIDFSRGTGDGKYNKTPTGENSYVVDSANGQIFIVQGARIVTIDLTNDFAYTLFQQDYSDIGKLSFYKDRLLFTLEGNPYYDPGESTEHSNELIVIHPRTGAVHRYGLESGWYSEGLDEQQSDQLILWSYLDPNNRSWDPINRGSLPLDRSGPLE
ncbi:MAG: hypothetical protein WD424_10705 [Paenibacillaceae bacterium]